MPGHEHRFLSGYEVMGYDGSMHGIENALRISSASSTACTLDGHADREKSKKIGASSVKFPTFFVMLLRFLHGPLEYVHSALAHPSYTHSHYMHVWSDPLSCK